MFVLNYQAMSLLSLSVITEGVVVAHSEEGVEVEVEEEEAVVAQTKSRMRTALGADMVITVAESVRGRKVFVTGVELWVTLRKHVIVRKMGQLEVEKQVAGEVDAQEEEAEAEEARVLVKEKQMKSPASKDIPKY